MSDKIERAYRSSLPIENKPVDHDSVDPQSTGHEADIEEPELDKTGVEPAGGGAAVETAPIAANRGIVYTMEEAQAAQRKLPIWVSVAVIGAISVVSFWLAFNPEWVMGFGRWGYVGAFFISAVASATIILPAPGIAVIIAMGASLDPIWLGIVAGIGSAFGELTGYVAGASGRAFVPQRQRLQFERLHDLTNRYGALLLFGLAAIPFPLFDFAGIISGMLRMRVVLFLVSVSLGKCIKYVIMILVGGSVIHWLQDFLFNPPPVF